MQIRHSHVILDTCFLINFSASGHLIEILQSIPARVFVTETVREKELLTLPNLKDEENAIQFHQPIEQKILLVVDFESEAEEELFVNYAYEIGDDGESATGAIATDDKKATSVFKREAPHLQILSTLEIVKSWSEKINLSPSELRILLSDIRVKGRYQPPKNHPLLSWWENVMK
ncbi:MAG: hypothetical protein D6728_14195 [Cyanobacteria bacterium J055]|nr:MAG: hypothetical protein D6728_14195 [Cyanobacteria bacterium J055]